MIIIIGVLIGIIIGIIQGIVNNDGIWGLFYSTMGGLLGGVIAFLITLLSTAIISECDFVSIRSVEEQRVELVALKDNINMNRNYYICRASVDEELKYNYLYEEKGKGITSGSVNADQTYINYIKEGEKPYLIKRKIEPTNLILRFLTTGSIDSEYSLYIPNDSIIVENKYEIDLE